MALQPAPLTERGGHDDARRDVPVRLLQRGLGGHGDGHAGGRGDDAPIAATATATATATAEFQEAVPPSVADGDHRFRTLIEQAADGIFVTDAAGRVVLANSRMCLLLGYSTEEIVGLDVLDTYLPDDRDVGRQFLSQLPPSSTFRFERMLRRKDGSAFPIEASVAWLPGGERQTIVRDMSARKRADEALRMEDRRLRALVRLTELESPSLQHVLAAALDEVCALVWSPFAFVAQYVDRTGELAVVAWSREVGSLGGELPIVRPVATSGLLGAAIRDRKPIIVNSFAAAPEAGLVEPLGSAYPPLERFMAIPIRSRGRIVGVVGVGNKPADYGDTDVRQLTQMIDVVWRMAERQQAEDDLRRLNEDLERRVAERTAEYEAANARLEGINGQLEATNAQLQALVAEQESLQAELAYQALHDPLTGLGNRLLFNQRLEYAFEQTRRGVAVLWIDLDRFKQINDIFGHEVGDEVLVAFADKLREVLRTTDDIARMGGDEFAIVLPNVYESDARVVADRVLEALDDSGSFRLRVGASVGIAWQPPGAADRKTLVRRADLAMYRAKVEGGGIVAA